MDNRKNSFSERRVRQWHRLLRKVVEAFKNRLDVALRTGSVGMVGVGW